MMKHFFLALCLLMTIAVRAEDSIPLADPFILLEDGIYYAYGTHAPDGIEVFTSADLQTWQSGGLALSKQHTTEDQWFWAPEVYCWKDRYFMLYSANEHLFVATSDSPRGPFRQRGGRLLEQLIGDEKCIDSSVFVDEDGRAYLYFVRFTDGNFIWMCQLDEDLQPIPGTMRPCFGVTAPWEQHLGRVAEGPFVIKRKGTYYLTYSANDFRSHDYGVGYATSTSPLGPWQKSDSNPILSHHRGRYGTGHHSFFTDKKGRLRIVYHAHRSATEVYPRMMYLGTAKWKKDRLTIRP